MLDNIDDNNVVDEDDMPFIFFADRIPPPPPLPPLVALPKPIETMIIASLSLSLSLFVSLSLMD